MSSKERKEIKVVFEVLTAVSTKMAVFWVVMPCSLVEDKLIQDYTIEIKLP
jgi:hypothetical protein